MSDDLFSMANHFGQWSDKYQMTFKSYNHPWIRYVIVIIYIITSQLGNLTNLHVKLIVFTILCWYS